MVVGGLVGAWLRTRTPSPPPVPPLEEQLLALDLPAAQAAVSGALESMPRQRALPRGNETRAQSFLSLTVQAAALDLEALDSMVAPAAHGLSHVDFTLEVSGDLFELPALLEGLHRQTALVLVEGLAVDAQPGGLMNARVVVRYLRPDAGEADWIDERLATASSGADRATPVLGDAATLLAWRQFEDQLPLLEAEQDLRRRGLSRDLPEALIALRSTGGGLRWSPEQGVIIR